HHRLWPRPEPARAGPGRRHPGRAAGRRGRRAVAFDDSVAAKLAAGAAFAAAGRPSPAGAGAMGDEVIRRRARDPPPAEPDEHDARVDLDPPSSLDLRAERVAHVVWCTGVRGDFGWVGPGLVGAR